MPCTDGGPSIEQQREPGRVAACLCGILSSFECTGFGRNGLTVKGVLDAVDWKEVGVTRKWLEGWWEEHKREDRERKREEEAESRRLKLVEQALGKLSVKERRALGLR